MRRLPRLLGSFAWIGISSVLVGLAAGRSEAQVSAPEPPPQVDAKVLAERHAEFQERIRRQVERRRLARIRRNLTMMERARQAAIFNPPVAPPSAAGRQDLVTDTYSQSERERQEREQRSYSPYTGGN